MAASDCAQPASRSIRCAAQYAGPHRSLAVFEQRCHKEFTKLRVLGQLAAIPAYKASKRANPKSAVARDEQTIRSAGEMLTRRGLPGDSVNAIKAKQAEFAAQPEIPIGRLSHREDGAHGEPVPGGPRGMRVLADIQRRVQRKNGRQPRAED